MARLDLGRIRGQDGKEGKQGEKGEQGNPGVIVEMNGIYAFEIQGDDLVILYDDGSAPPAMHIDDNGDLIWEVQ